MTLTVPANGQYNWDVTLNAALNTLDSRTAVLEARTKVTAPVHSNSTGVLGQWATDTSYFYVCVGTNTWVRSAISTSW
jgi:hypothetical protein